MNIGTVARKSGLPAKTIRYYEHIGLITPASRRPNGYRTYSLVDMRTLHFIKRARSLGFSIEEVCDLLDLWRNTRRSSADVKALATRHLEVLDRKIEELQTMRKTLADLIKRCRGDARPECPILEDIEDGDRNKTGSASPGKRPPRRQGYHHRSDHNGRQRA